MKRKVGAYGDVYKMLMSEYGPQGWWPVTEPGRTRPEYSGGPKSDAQRFEVAVGAVLTQNTSWNNASRAIESINSDAIMNPAGILGSREKDLAALIRPSGYYNQKARRLRTIAGLFMSGREITRESLLSLDGIGFETADSIMLYGFGRRIFVVDAYTKRIFSRLGLIDERAQYEEIRSLFEENLPGDCQVYNEYHALIIEHGKRFCTKSPRCGRCPIKGMCGFNFTQAAKKEGLSGQISGAISKSY